MLERTWKTMSRHERVDLAETIKGLVRERPRDVHVGCDSQNDGPNTEFVTVVVVLDPGKGGRAFFTREKLPRVKSLRERLQMEVWRAIETAMELSSGLVDALGNREVDITIHVDANPDRKHRSSDHVQELAGMVVGQGFKLLLKPDSWCASHAADHVVKHMLGRAA